MTLFGRYLGMLIAGLALSACEIPTEGPGRSLIEETAYTEGANTSGFVLIDVNRQVADYLRVKPEPGFGDRFGKGRPIRAEQIGIGDVLMVRIWEADIGGLFSSTGLVNRGEIPAVVVDTEGNISIPYAGRIRAAGRTPNQIADAIVAQLQAKTVEPQVHVTRAENVANTVRLTGTVARPGVVPLTLRGDSLLDTIAAAGGSQYPGYETLVSLTRGGQTLTAYLEDVLNSPEDDIYLRPRDEIHLERRPKTFTAFGAVTNKGMLDFGATHVSVLEAVGRVSGLVDNRADPRGVFLMRFEPAESAYALIGQENKGDAPAVVPTIYRYNLYDPNQYFFAQVVGLRDKDIVYVANSPSVEMAKFLAILRGLVGTAGAAASVGGRAVTVVGP
jgi:polysaccharide export outer membrane protein